jgi:hypothetical protein
VVATFLTGRGHRLQVCRWIRMAFSTIARMPALCVQPQPSAVQVTV